MPDYSLKRPDFSQQEIYAKRVADKVCDYYGYTPKACVVTFGCQQNVSDSEKL